MPLSSSPSLPPSPPPPSLSFTLYCELKRASLATATALKSEGVPFALPYFAKSWRALASVLSEEVDRGNGHHLCKCWLVTNTATASCTPGTYLASGACANCPGGRFQNEINKSICKNCQVGKMRTCSDFTTVRNTTIKI